MALKNFYRDDVLGYVTSSNSIPWLYDLDHSECDVTTPSLAAETDAGNSEVRSASVNPVVDAALQAKRTSSQTNYLAQDCDENIMSSADSKFVKNFTESIGSSVMIDDFGSWNFFVISADVAAAVSKLTRIYVRNVAVLGLAVMLVQAPFYGVRSFLSSLGGLSGRWALVAYHAGVMVAVPIARYTDISARVRPKTSLVISVIASLPFTVVAATFPLSFTVMTSLLLLLPVTAAVAGTAAAWVAETHDTYVTSLGASCAALSEDHQRRTAAGGRPIAGHFIRVFAQYLLVMQQLSLFVGNFATSTIIATTTPDLPAVSPSTALST